MILFIVVVEYVCVGRGCGGGLCVCYVLSVITYVFLVKFGGIGSKKLTLPNNHVYYFSLGKCNKCISE